MSSKVQAHTEAGSVSAQDGQPEGFSNGYSRTSLPTQESVDGRDQSQPDGSIVGNGSQIGSQSDFPPASSVACELGTNFEGRSEAALSRSSGGAVSAGASAAERDDASATDHWSMQNDEIAPHVAASPEDSARRDSYTYTPTEVSRDEQWATRSTGTGDMGERLSGPLDDAAPTGGHVSGPTSKRSMV